MNIGLLECDHVPRRYRAIAGGYREMFDALLRPHDPALSFTYYDVCHGELPDTAAACDAYVCTGSRYSVYQEEPWIEALKGFVRRLHDDKRCFVGVCFGHQMLAEALGGKVSRSGSGWGVGVHAMRVVEREPWMQPALETCRLQYMHADQVSGLPSEGAVLARSEHCDVAMFRVGRTMIGIEGHPEFPAAYNEALIRDRTDAIGAGRAQSALSGVYRPTDHAVVGGWMVNFLRRGAQ